MMTNSQKSSLIGISLLLKACTLTFTGDEQDYDIKATVVTPDCTVTIDRKEVRTDTQVDTGS